MAPKQLEQRFKRCERNKRIWEANKIYSGRVKGTNSLSEQPKPLWSGLERRGERERERARQKRVAAGPRLISAQGYFRSSDSNPTGFPVNSVAKRVCSDGNDVVVVVVIRNICEDTHGFETKGAKRAQSKDSLFLSFFLWMFVKMIELMTRPANKVFCFGRACRFDTFFVLVNGSKCACVRKTGNS
jgi:hypothetical protein